MALDLNLQPEVNNKQNFIPNQILTSTHMNELVNDLKRAAAADSVEEILVIDSITPTVTIGGITKGTTLSDKNLAELLRQLLCPYVAPTGFSISLVPNATQYEYGKSITITGVTPKFTNGSLNSLSLMLGTSSGGNQWGTFSNVNSNSQVSINKSHDGLSTLTVHATLSDGEETITASTKVEFPKYCYVGATGSTTIPSEASFKQHSAKSSDCTIETENDQYIWFLMPDNSKKQIQQYSMSQWNNMATTAAGTVSFKTATNQTLTYYAYRTDKLTEAKERYQII